MKPFVIASLLCCFAFAETPAPVSDVPALYPHPLIESAMDLNGGGYSPISFDAHPGLAWETSKISFTGIADYSFAKKTNDGTAGNNTGHSRSLNGDVFYKLNQHWMVGGGGDWGKTYTTNYKKLADSWRVGGGRDWFRDDISFRITAEYFRHFNESTSYPTLQTFATPTGGTIQAYGCKCTNGVQGVIISFIEPSPYTAHHFFFHVESSVFGFHDTVTDPYDYALTRTQNGVHHLDGSSSISFIYRF